MFSYLRFQFYILLTVIDYRSTNRCKFIYVIWKFFGFHWFVVLFLMLLRFIPFIKCIILFHIQRLSLDQSWIFNHCYRFLTIIHGWWCLKVSCFPTPQQWVAIVVKKLLFMVIFNLFSSFFQLSQQLYISRF